MGILRLLRREVFRGSGEFNTSKGRGSEAYEVGELWPIIPVDK